MRRIRLLPLDAVLRLPDIGGALRVVLLVHRLLRLPLGDRVRTLSLFGVSITELLLEKLAPELAPERNLLLPVLGLAAELVLEELSTISTSSLSSFFCVTGSWYCVAQLGKRGTFGRFQPSPGSRPRCGVRLFSLRFPSRSLSEGVDVALVRPDQCSRVSWVMAPLCISVSEPEGRSSQASDPEPKAFPETSAWRTPASTFSATSPYSRPLPERNWGQNLVKKTSMKNFVW